jgi:hypothetical protein
MDVVATVERCEDASEERDTQLARALNPLGRG